jgi:hypothetical protein
MAADHARVSARRSRCDAPPWEARARGGRVETILSPEQMDEFRRTIGPAAVPAEWVATARGRPRQRARVLPHKG